MSMRRFFAALALLAAAGAGAAPMAWPQPTRPAAARAQLPKNGAEGGAPAAGKKLLDEENPAAAQPLAEGAEKTRVTAVRLLSSNSYTRVTMDLSQQARYEVRRLRDERAKGLPPRIYVDIFDATLAMDSKEPISVRDGMVQQVRVGQFSQDVVRVVLDLENLREHNAFLLVDPYRLVIDIQGRENSAAPVSMEKNKALKPQPKSAKPPAPGIKKIVLDPGHGGKDPGAIGVDGVAEKDVVLRIAKKLAAKLKREMGVEVVLTRKDDSFVPLEDRTAIANAEDADLFISLHMNASPNEEARGIETYYLDATSDEASIRLAARENGTSRKNISDLQLILSSLTQNMKLEDSITLAHRLHGSLVDGMAKKLGDIRDLGVKKALFYVLVGARMPSVLVEMFFITNKSEGRAMSRDSSQNSVVDALFDGIKKYESTALAAKTL